MEIDTRKLRFVREFLRLSDEKVIGKLEKMLWEERKKKIAGALNPMTKEEFNKMIDRSEKDHESGKVAEARTLLKEIEKWK